MSKQYIHVGQFVINTDDRDKFIQIIKDYEENVTQAGLDHSHLVELDNKLNNFRYITIWKSRTAWEAVEELDAHKAMHKDRDPLLAEPAKAIMGSVII